MNKVTIVKNENFTTVSNVPLQNKDLSWKAKGLLMYLMTLPASWKVQLSDLENRSTDGRDSTNGAIKELMDHGYISRVPVTEKGKFKGYDYTVSDEPKPTATGFPQRLDRNGSSATENPLLVNTQVVNTKEEKEPLTPKVGTPELFPTEQPGHRNVSKENIAQQAMIYLNEKTGSKFRAYKGTGLLGLITSGTTLETIKAVIDIKVSKWAGTDMAQYLTPSTLFRASNFERYENELRLPKTQNSTPLFNTDPNDADRFHDPLKGKIKLRGAT